ESPSIEVERQTFAIDMGHGSGSRLGAHVGGGPNDRLLDAAVGHTATEIAVHVVDDLLLGRIGILGQQSSGLHDLARLAVAALGHLLELPRDLQRMRLAAAQPFDGRDLLAGGLLGRSLTGAHGDSVEMHRAGAAKARAAAELGAGHLQLLADDPQERRVVGSIDLPRLPIDDERDHVSSVADAEIARRDSPDRPRRLPPGCRTHATQRVSSSTYGRSWARRRTA